MAIIKVTKRKVKKPQNASAMRNLIDYVKKHEHENGLAMGFNCNTASAFQEFLLNKKIHHKTDGRLYIHMIQSFPKDLITPEKAFELGQKLINEHPLFAIFQIVMGNIRIGIIYIIISASTRLGWMVKSGSFLIWSLRLSGKNPLIFVVKRMCR